MKQLFNSISLSILIQKYMAKATAVALIDAPHQQATSYAETPCPKAHIECQHARVKTFYSPNDNIQLQKLASPPYKL